MDETNVLLTAILSELQQIHALLVTPPAPTTPATCAHPQEARVEMSGMGTEEFFCRTCGEQHIATAVVDQE